METTKSKVQLASYILTELCNLATLQTNIELHAVEPEQLLPFRKWTLSTKCSTPSLIVACQSFSKMNLEFFSARKIQQRKQKFSERTKPQKEVSWFLVKAVIRKWVFKDWRLHANNAKFQRSLNKQTLQREEDESVFCSNFWRKQENLSSISFDGNLTRQSCKHNWKWYHDSH